MKYLCIVLLTLLTKLMQAQYVAYMGGNIAYRKHATLLENRHLRNISYCAAWVRLFKTEPSGMLDCVV
jgi:hypothetical protein